MEHASFKNELPLAIAIIPLQRWETPYDPSRGLQQGTIFPCLDLPFFITSDVITPIDGKGGGIHV